MKSLLTLIMFILLSSSIAIAQTVIDFKKIMDNKSLSNLEKAQKITDEAEKLVHPVGFMYAHGLFSQALHLDPSHKKARFYYNMIDMVYGSS